MMGQTRSSVHIHISDRISLLQVNDSLAETQLCLHFSPLEVAAGCLHLASAILGIAKELPHSRDIGWWRAIGVDLMVIEEIGHSVCDAAEARQHLASTAAEAART